MSLTLRHAHSTQRNRVQTSTLSPVALITPHAKSSLNNGASKETVHEEEGTPSPRKRTPSNKLFTFPSSFLLSPSTDDAQYTLDTHPDDATYQPLSETKGNDRKGQQWTEHDHYYQTVLTLAAEWINSCLVCLFALCYVLLILLKNAKIT